MSPFKSQSMLKLAWDAQNFGSFPAVETWKILVCEYKWVWFFAFTYRSHKNSFLEATLS